MTTQQTALITGASRGLGLALARELARRGWSLLIDARGAEALTAARAELSGFGDHARVIAVAGDVTDAAHRDGLVEAARALGGLDAIINNASSLGVSPLPPLLDYPLDALETTFRANVIAPLAVLQATRDQLKPGARIINVTSDAGVEAYPGWGGYGASKAALEQLSHVLAAERPDLRVYWVDPGDMRTQMHQDAFPGEDISDRPLPEESAPGLVALLTGTFPSGRYQARALLDSAAMLQAAGESAIRETRIALTVTDFDQALAFYRDGLGLALVEDWTASETGRSAVLAAGRASIELLDERDATYTDRVEVGERVTGPTRLALEVESVAVVAASLQERGARLLHAPVHTSWGTLTQRVQAPDGMQISLYQKDQTDRASE